MAAGLIQRPSPDRISKLPLWNFGFVSCHVTRTHYDVDVRRIYLSTCRGELVSMEVTYAERRRRENFPTPIMTEERQVTAKTACNVPFIFQYLENVEMLKCHPMHTIVNEP